MLYSLLPNNCWSWVSALQTDSPVLSWKLQVRTKHLYFFTTCGFLHRMLLLYTLVLLLSSKVKLCNADSDSQVINLEYNVAEGEETGFRVGDIAADSATSGPYTYVPTGTEAVWLQWNDAGVISLKQPLDRETLSEYNLFAFTQSSSRTINIHISVTDENDNRPEFPRNMIVILFSENVAVGSRRTLDSASDPDLAENSVVGYNISGGNADNYFRIEYMQAIGNENILQLDLVINKKLDRETISHYDLVIQAFDGGNPPLTGSMNVSIEILDINESPPSFPVEVVYVNLSESLPVGAKIVKVNATDTDSGANAVVIYEILEVTNPTDIFRIDSATGEIFLNKQLDYEEDSSYSLVIIASDNGTSPLQSSMVVIVAVQNENEDPPTIFITYTSGDGTPKISEDASLGDFVARISVNDPDNDSEELGVTVSIIGGLNHFSLTTKDDIIYLICVAEPLDREEVASYDIVIRAMDSASPPLVTEKGFTLIVEDVNDNPPSFQPLAYIVSKSETSLNGTLVVTVFATDRDVGRNAEITYSIMNAGDPFVDWFVIHPQSGMITTVKLLDREETSEVVLTVMAKDLGVPSLNSTTTVTVTITDVNDNYPIFTTSPYNSSISEDVPPRTCFLQVQATDADAGSSGQVIYSIGTGPGTPSHSQFAIDPDSGSICTTQELDRDGGITSFDFQVRATDGGGLSSVVLVEIFLLDVNDNTPEFYPESYAVDIYEYSQQNMVVTSVSAEDRDSGRFGIVTYAIVSGNDNLAFRINPRTGDIIVDRPLDRSERNVYLLEVSATDGGDKSSVINAQVTVNIFGPDDPRPVFVKTRYVFTVPENSDHSYFIGTVQARNSDAGNLSPVTYTIHSGDPHGFFNLHPSSGQFTVLSPPDREVQPYALLNIQAESGNPPSYASAQVNISIEDINDNAPSFQGFALFTHISENEPLNSVVFIANAMDPDAGLNGEIRYQLIENPGDTFSITSHTGRVTLVREVNYEVQDRYTLVIRAYDLGIPEQDTQLTFIVYVTDVNNHGPQFNSPSYQETVSESARIGQSILQVSATDRDTGSNAEITFTLSPSASASKFGIIPDTGWIYLHHRLDYELEEEYLLDVIATDNGNEPKSATAAVHIIVADANDNYPHFDREIYTFREDENIAIGETIGVVVARDRDSRSNGRIRYAMITDGPFTIGEVTGFITTTRMLDYEEQAGYNLEITATDNGDPPKSDSATVILHVNDLNDNSPVFSHPSEYKASVKEDEPTDTTVLLVVARDADSGAYGQVTYSLDPDVVEFKIDATTGIVTTARVLDRETQDRFSLTVRASDGGNPSRTSVVSVDVKVRDVNDNAPSVVGDDYAFNVNESAPQGSRIGVIVAFDPDAGGNGMLYFSIIAGNTYGMFAINRTTGVLVNTKEVDFEIAAHHQLEVLVEDQGSVRPRSVTVFVEINVLDANDNYPVFQVNPVYIAVVENSPESHPIWTFRATDADSGVNGDIRYRLVPGQSLLTIDPLTGVLTTTQGIDREMVSELHFTVEAEDQATDAARKKTSASVVCIIVDENDNSPFFTSRSVTHVMEDEPIGYPIIHITAEDPDSGINGDIIYQIAQGNADGKFALGPDTGLLTISHSLDHEHKRKYELNISAHDQGAVQRVSFQGIEIYVEDVNDHAPLFQEVMYVFNVSEEQAAGLLVGQVVAIDADSGDNGRLTYDIPEGIANNHFEIDSQSGVIRTRVQLDREVRDYYRLTVYVMDGAFPSFYDLTTITVYVMDINDNPPMFASNLYSLTLPEAQITGIFHVVAAFDPDIQRSEMIHYQIIDGNVDNRFSLDSLTGELMTQNTLDRESTPDYNLTVMAVDGSDHRLNSTTIIRIEVMDINDNNPIFMEPFYEVTLAEDTEIGTMVVTVEATDRDSGLNGAILYSLDNTTRRLFAVDELTGKITTAGRFDFEKEDQHVFQVRATDQGAVDQIGPRSEQVQVKVTLMDVNDNAPVFEDKPIRANISIGTGANTMVATLRAEDKDSGLNGDVHYRLQEPSSEFAVQGHIVMTKTTLTQEHFYQMKVVAYDSGSPSLSTEASLEIWVTNSNTWTLAFTSSAYRASVQEDASADTNILTVGLSNPPDREIEFSIASGNQMAAFKLLTTDGGTTTIQIQNSSTLDYETNPEIVLILEARDSAERSIPLYGYTKVTVTLQDANDNAPRFTQDRYSSSVSEGNETSTYVTQVSAVDADEGSNAAISYHIIGGNTNNAFAIDEVTGIITTNGNLDREVEDLYRLILRARDNGTPRKDDTVMIKVTINDLNDNRPIFPIYDPMYISEGLEIGSVVTTVTADDPDINPTITYSFAAGGNPDRMFNIDAYSGTITLAEPLDRERQSVYTLLVTASDSKHSDQSYLVVHIQDENDNAPVFTEQSYQVSLPELTPPGHLVMKVNATDADSGENARIRFSMDVPPIQEFSIDPDTGSIYTQQDIQYNIAQPVIQLVVTATDQGTPSLSQVIAVRIKVLDVNNNAPEFSSAIYQGSVMENAPEDTLVVTVIASDDDVHFANQKIDYSIVSGNEEDKFFISVDSGDIKVFRPLDRETTAVYTLIVMSTDRGSPQRNSTAEVVIEILDVNDHAPVFSPSEYSGDISERAEVGAPILTVYTFDLDKDQNAQVVYDIISGNDKGYFAIDGNSGLISVRGELDHEEMPEARLVVQASDRGMNSSSSNAIVHINITDENDNRPYFPVMMYLERVAENTPPGVVFTAEALDKDTGIYGRLEYSIIDSNGKRFFEIDPRTGEVRSKQMFDYEDVQSYILKIRAMDFGQESVQVQAQVSITGVDEFAPVFNESSYKFEIKSDAKVGFQVGRVGATDEDKGPDGVILYAFQNEEEYFLIDENTGIITVRKDLNSNNRRSKRAIDESFPFIIIGSSGRAGSLATPVSAAVSVTTTGGITGAQSGTSTSSLIIILVGAAMGVLILLVLCFLVALLRIKKREREHQVDGDNLNHSVSPRFYEGTFDKHIEMGHGIMNPNVTEKHMLRGHNSPRGMYGVPPTNSSMEVGHLTKTDQSDQSHSASSGRGSATVEDEEIRQINSRTVPRQPRDILDSGIQPDHEDGSYSASDMNSPRSKPFSTSVESMHVFGEEGGDEAGGQIGHLIYAQLDEAITDEDIAVVDGVNVFGYNNEVQTSMGGSLSSIVNSEEEFSGSYNWDYLLDWGPQFQPLAHVFAEIAKLKDETFVSKSEGSPFQQKAFQPVNKTYPPPLITNVVHGPIKQLNNSMQQNNSMNQSHLMHGHPSRSPITYDNSLIPSAVTPDLSPSLSPLAPGTPSLSPLVTSTTGVSSTQSSQRNSGSSKTFVSHRTPRSGMLVNTMPSHMMHDGEIQI